MAGSRKTNLSTIGELKQAQASVLAVPGQDWGDVAPRQDAQVAGEGDRLAWEESKVF